VPIYSYKALTADGKTATGIIDAESLKLARQKLRRSGYYPTEISEEKEKKRRLLSTEISLKTLMRQVGIQEVAVATRQLATLVGAGIPLVSSLTALVEQVDNMVLKKVLSQIREKVNEGSSFSNALAEHRKIFGDLFINMVRAGEQSGTLDIVLYRLADFSENQLALRNKIRGTLAYPAIMLLVGLGIVSYLITFVIPKVSKIFEGLEMSLPLVTQVLLGTANALKDFWWIFLLILGGAIYLFKRWRDTPEGRERFDAFVLRTPVAGKLVMKIAVSRFARTLGTLLKSGVPVLVAMDIVKNVLNNRVLTKAVETARESISEGEGISGPLKKCGVFPPLVHHMITVGEQTGELEDMLFRVSDAYENEVETTISNLTAFLEPVMILIMGGFVAFVVLSVLLPILDMTQGLK